MDDDLNVGIALASLFDFVREINNLIDSNEVSSSEASEIRVLLMHLDEVLGIIGKVEPPRHYRVVLTETLGFGDKVEPKGHEATLSDIDVLVQKREEARKAKNWKEADAIRAQLKAMGIVLEDTAQGVLSHKEKA